MIHKTFLKFFAPFQYPWDSVFKLTATPSMPKHFESGLPVPDSIIKTFPLDRRISFGDNVKVTYLLVKPKNHDVEISVPDADGRYSGSRMLIVHGGQDKTHTVRVTFAKQSVTLVAGGYLTLDSIEGSTVQHAVLSGGVKGA